VSKFVHFGDQTYIQPKLNAQRVLPKKLQVIYCRYELLQQIPCCKKGFIVNDNYRCQPSTIRHYTISDKNKIRNYHRSLKGPNCTSHVARRSKFCGAPTRSKQFYNRDDRAGYDVHDRFCKCSFLYRNRTITSASDRPSAETDTRRLKSYLNRW
jgi:hypothetical protein